MTRFLTLPAVALAVGITLAPLLFLLRVSLYESGGERGFYSAGTVTLDHYRALAYAPITLTIGFALAIAVITTAIGFGLALFLHNLPPSRQSMALAMLLTPKLAGPLSVAFGLQLVLPRGPLTALLAEIVFVLPYAVLAILLRLRHASPDLVPAARGLGATRWQALRRVTLPLARPGVALAFQLSLAWGLGATVGPLFLAGPGDASLGTQIQSHVAELRWPVAATEAVVLLGLTAAAFSIARSPGHP